MTTTVDRPKAKLLAPIAANVPTMGSVIDTLWSLREEKRLADAEVTKIETKIEAQEKIVMERLAEQGIRKADGRKGSVSLGETIVANVKDWATFHAYIAKTKHFHLLQRRVSDLAWRELMEKNGAKGVPGTEAFTKKKLNLRSLSETI